METPWASMATFHVERGAPGIPRDCAAYAQFFAKPAGQASVSPRLVHSLGMRKPHLDEQPVYPYKSIVGPLAELAQREGRPRLGDPYIRHEHWTRGSPTRPMQPPPRPV